MFRPAQLRGFGCVSPIGLDVRETTVGLRDAKDGVSEVRHFAVTKCQSRTAGQVDESLSERARDIHRPAKRWTRAAQMVLVAMEEALEASPGFQPDCAIIGTTSGGMTLGEGFYRALVSQSGVSSACRKVRAYVPQEPVLQALSRFGLDGTPVRIVSNACASGTNALGMAGQMIRTGAAKRVLAGGYDALAELVFAGFDCLRASTPDKCRPFDAKRNGLVLGEGAAIFCLEAGESGLCLTGYGSAIDTHHLTQPHPSGSGPRAAMQRALESRGAEPETVDYINAHGTGTPLNDSSEAQAILEICPKAPVSSTKGMTGHALGAAGAIEAAYCAIALSESFLPPTINFSTSEFPLNLIANVSRKACLRRVLSNSFGFGGANACLVMEHMG